MIYCYHKKENKKLMITFDDGILKIYEVENLSAAGDKPVKGLKLKTAEKYSIGELGVTRFYYAMQNNQQIDIVANVNLNNLIRVNDVAVDEYGNQFLIRMVQLSNDDGIRYMRLSLERLKQNYAKIKNC